MRGGARASTFIPVMSTMRTTTRDDYHQRLLRVLSHIQKNLDAPLPLDELASVACFSPFHFHRIFKGMTGESVKQHIRRLRLERAASRLLHSDLSVTQFAYDAGYETPEAFSRAFRSAFGVSPQPYREQVRAKLHVPAPTDVHYDESGVVTSFDRVDGKEMKMEVEIREIPPMRVAYIRHTGPYNEVGETWGRLCTWAGMKGLIGPGTRMCGACYDDPDVTPEDKVRYDACLTVSDDVEGEGEIGVQVIGGGTYAVAVHRGAYEKLGETYTEVVGRWFITQGREPGDPPCIDFYFNDPDNTPEDELVTEVCVPIAGA